MEINCSDLHELINDEDSISLVKVFKPLFDFEPQIEIVYGYDEFLTLSHMYDQVFLIIAASSTMLNIGETTNVDEVLDIVL